MGGDVLTAVFLGIVPHRVADPLDDLGDNGPAQFVTQAQLVHSRDFDQGGQVARFPIPIDVGITEPHHAFGKQAADAPPVLEVNVSLGARLIGFKYPGVARRHFHRQRPLSEVGVNKMKQPFVTGTGNQTAQTPQTL